ncbi:unnamed protein product, partial [marine sediment metagenome]
DVYTNTLRQEYDVVALVGMKEVKTKIGSSRNDR